MPYAGTRLGRWWYEAEGEGEPIVLLHGLMLDRTAWAPQWPELAAMGRVIAFDGPGHGRSDPPRRFTLEEHADALGDALDMVGARRAVLVGHSWGGLVALRFALRHPERVAGLVLVGASAAPEPPAVRAEYEALVAAVRAIGVPRWFVRLRVGAIVYGRRARRERPELVDALHATMRAHPRAGFLRAALAVVRRGSVDRDLGRVTAPTLVVCGRDDRTMPPHRSDALWRGIEGARMALVDCGHTPNVERPDLFDAFVLPFVQERVEAERAARAAARRAGEGEGAIAVDPAAAFALAAARARGPRA